ncbi:hypothetical protein D1007_38182 [Hordeum vulgare]|nr:hypothetical protein D1007_38182 [Hordeum vulgare]
MHPSMQREGCTAIASSSHARLERVNAQAMLLMACKLLRYRPADAGYDTWLGRIIELVTATREDLTPSRSVHTPPSRDGEVAQGAPPPHPAHIDQAEPRRDARPGNHPHMPKKKKIAARSSVARLRSTRVRSSSRSVSARIGSPRMSQ